MFYLFYIFIILVINLIVFIIYSIILSYKSYNYLRKNKKLFKYLFKMSSPKPKVKDVVQIIIVIILSAFLVLAVGIVGTITTLLFYSSHSCSERACQGVECRSLIKRNWSTLNQVVSLEKQLEGKIDYSNEKAFAEILSKRLSLIDTYNTSYKNKEKTLSEKEMRKYNLKEYKNKPILLVADGSTIMVLKFENGCKNVDLVNVENSSCLIDVDINGFMKKPNNKDVENIKQKRLDANDRYTFIIDGNRDKVLLPELTTTLYEM